MTPGLTSAESFPFSPTTTLLQVGGTQARSASAKHREAGRADRSAIHRPRPVRAFAARSTGAAVHPPPAGAGRVHTEPHPQPSWLLPLPPSSVSDPALDVDNSECESCPSPREAKAHAPRGRSWGKRGQTERKIQEAVTPCTEEDSGTQRLGGPRPRATGHLGDHLHRHCESPLRPPAEGRLP